MIDRPSADSCSSLSSSLESRSWIARKSLRRSSCATSRIERSARSTRGLVGVHAMLDLVVGVQVAPQHRVLADDARVLADVADSGDGAREQVDRGAAADAVEQAALLEVLDERERVDRLADRVEVEHGLEDQAVRLAIEVLGLEALVDDQRRQRGVRQQHRARRRPARLSRRSRWAAPPLRSAMAIGAVESRSATGALRDHARLSPLPAQTCYEARGFDEFHPRGTSELPRQ